MNLHAPDCRWLLTTPDECSYRTTHHYCPHSEHACSCPPSPVVLPTTTDGLARSAYLAYGDGAKWRNFRGDPMPQWDDLPAPQQACWRRAVEAVRLIVRDDCARGAK